MELSSQVSQSRITWGDWASARRRRSSILGQRLLQFRERKFRECLEAGDERRGQEFATSVVLKTLLVRLEAEALKMESELDVSTKGRASLRHLLQHQGSSETCNRE